MALLRIACCLAALLVAPQLITAKYKPDAVYEANKEDIKYIKCQVCELLAKNAFRQVKAMREELKPGKQLSEMAVIEKVEKMTDPAKDEGEWIAKVDLVESGKQLKVEEQDQLGQCRRECKTVQKAAQQVVGDYDTDIAETLWQGKKTRAQFTNWLCYELTKVCLTKPPPLPKGRIGDEEFLVMDAQDRQLQQMMANMKDTGMGAQLYDRESMMQKYMGGYNEDYDESDDTPEHAKASVEELDDGAPQGQETASSVHATVNKVTEVAADAMSKAKDAGSKLLDAGSKLLSGWKGQAGDSKKAEHSDSEGGTQSSSVEL